MTKVHSCPHCDKIFDTKWNLDRHFNRKIKCNANICPQCNHKFSKKINYDYHISRDVCLRKSETIKHNNESMGQTSCNPVKSPITDINVELIRHTVKEVLKHQPNIQSNFAPRRGRSRSINRDTSRKRSKSVVRFQEPNSVAVQSIDSYNLDTISGVEPLQQLTKCGKSVWILYLTLPSSEFRAPIRVLIENGVRRIHLFDFIQALTGCEDNVRNELTVFFR